jgi:hypothetical protein
VRSVLCVPCDTFVSRTRLHNCLGRLPDRLLDPVANLRKQDEKLHVRFESRTDSVSPSTRTTQAETADGKVRCSNVPTFKTCSRERCPSCVGRVPERRLRSVQKVEGRRGVQAQIRTKVSRES